MELDGIRVLERLTDALEPEVVAGTVAVLEIWQRLMFIRAKLNEMRGLEISVTSEGVLILYQKYIVEIKRNLSQLDKIRLTIIKSTLFVIIDEWIRKSLSLEAPEI